MSPQRTFLFIRAPIQGELLSSWVMGNSRGNLYKQLHTFTNLIVPGRPVWSRDVDWFSDPVLVQRLARITRTPVEAARRTTLASLEGVVFSQHRANARTPWIRPIGVYHRTRQQFGLQFCPRCLDESPVVYYRLQWRLGFVATCIEHRCVLREACPRCGRPVNFHRVQSKNSLSSCFSCSFDLRATPTIAAHPAVLSFQANLLKVMDRGWTSIGEYGPIGSVPFFQILRQLMRLVASGRAAAGLRRALYHEVALEIAPVPSGAGAATVERLSPNIRHDLLAAASVLLDRWPSRFVGMCSREKLWGSAVRRDWEDREAIPFAFADAVRQLDRTFYVPNPAEIESIRRYLIGTGQKPTASRMRALTGIDSSRFARG